MRIMLDQKKDDASSPVEETEGGRSPSGVSSTGSAPAWRPPPDPEVPEKPVRCKFTAEYKLKILAEADRCTEYGQIGGLLRREGLYSCLLYTSDAADEEDSVDLGGRRIITKKKKKRA